MASSTSQATHPAPFVTESQADRLHLKRLRHKAQQLGGASLIEKTWIGRKRRSFKGSRKITVA